jgi:hypothetical protein
MKLRFFINICGWYNVVSVLLRYTASNYTPSPWHLRYTASDYPTWYLRYTVSDYPTWYLRYTASDYPPWYLRYTASDYPLGILDIWLLITSLGILDIRLLITSLGIFKPFFCNIPKGILLSMHEVFLFFRYNGLSLYIQFLYNRNF